MAPFNIHCKFCSPMTRLDCRMAVLGVGVMVIVGLLVRTELAPRGKVWTMAGRGSVDACRMDGWISGNEKPASLPFFPPD